MHILFDFLHYIHTSCEVVEVVITTLARYMVFCSYFHGSIDKTGNAKLLHQNDLSYQNVVIVDTTFVLQTLECRHIISCHKKSWDYVQCHSGFNLYVRHIMIENQAKRLTASQTPTFFHLYGHLIHVSRLK